MTVNVDRSLELPKSEYYAEHEAKSGIALHHRPPVARRQEGRRHSPPRRDSLRTVVTAMSKLPNLSDASDSSALVRAHQRPPHDSSVSWAQWAWGSWWGG